MNRRQFLQTLGVAGLSSSVLAAVPPETLVVKPKVNDELTAYVLRFGRYDPVVVSGSPRGLISLRAIRTPSRLGEVRIKFFCLVGTHRAMSDVYRDYGNVATYSEPLRVVIRRGVLEQPLFTVERPLLTYVDVFSPVKDYWSPNDSELLDERTGSLYSSVVSRNFNRPDNLDFMREMRLTGIWSEYKTLTVRTEAKQSMLSLDSISFPAAKDMWCTTGDQQ